MKSLSRKRTAVNPVKTVRHGLALAAMVGVCALSAAANTGEVHLDAALEPAEIPFHRVMEYTISIERPAELDLDPPYLRNHFGGLPIQNGPIRDTTTLPGDRVRITDTYVLSPLEPGEYPIEPVTITWDEERQASTPSFVAVARELTQEEQEAVMRFMPNAPLATLPVPVYERREFWAGLAGLALAVIIAALVVRYWRRKRPEAHMSPWERAQSQLDALEAENLPAQGMAYRYYGELSQILREYIEQRFHLRAPERTTPEFLAEAASSGALTIEQQRFLERILRHSDRVKFAQFQAAPADMGEHMAEVRRFIGETASDATELKQDAA